MALEGGEARDPHAAPGLVAATARLAGFALAVALITSRVGLVLHELVGHGGAAAACGAGVREVRLFLFGGGWISYDRAAPWTWPEAIAVQLAGIAVELVLAAAVALVARRTRGPLAVALGGAALGLVVHAGFYLAAGTFHGVGDGALLHRRLGAARLWIALPVGAALPVIVFVGARRLGAAVRAWLPTRHGAAQVAALALALALAAGGHAGLAAAELRARPSPTYQAIMRPARDRAIDDDLARWRAAERAGGRAPDHAAEVRARRQLAAARPEVPFGILLAVAIALAAAAGAAWGRPAAPRPLPLRAVAWAVTGAVLAALSVGGIDALAP